MKKTFQQGIASIALSLISGATFMTNAQTAGRVIEYKSGPEGFDTRTFFYESEKEVIAFDAQFTPELAKKSIQHLRSFTQKPITHLIITHPNPDKFNGASVFKMEGAKILSSKSTAESIPKVHSYKEYYFVEIAKMFKPGEYPQWTPVDETFEHLKVLRLRNGEKIKIRELSQAGVSSSQTVAYIESIQSLFVGDLIHYKAHAWLEGGIENGKPTPNLEGWIQDLRELSNLFPSSTKIYGGRGLSSDLEHSVNEQIGYLIKSKEMIVDDLQARGKSSLEYKGPNASKLYKDLSLTFEKAFPDYTLPYMIEYGAYGLVLFELDKISPKSP